MNAQIIKLDALCTDHVNFFTIKFEGKLVSEFTEFYHRLKPNPINSNELKLIFTVLDEIGDRGAHKKYFNREENDAYALPPTGNEFFIETQDYGIRLYCVLINEKNVFLLNGDRKKALKAQDKDSNVSKYFYLANSLFKCLLTERALGMVAWNDEVFSYDKDYLINVIG